MKDFARATSQHLHPIHRYKQHRSEGGRSIDGVSSSCWRVGSSSCCWLRACCRRSVVRAGRATARLKVYLDCNNCFGDYIREEVDMVEYVRDPAEADVHIIVSSSDTGSGGTERAVALIGVGRFKGIDFKSRALSQSGDTEDTQRQRLATAITIGLLNYLSSDGDQRRADRRSRADGAAGPGRPRDRPVEFLGDEPAGLGRDDRRRKQPRARPERRARRRSDYRRLEDHDGLRDRIQREDFDLDEDEPLRAIRNERDFDALVARSLNDHWSVGGRASIDSSTFDNIAHPVVRRSRRSNTTSFRTRSTRAGSCASATPSARITRGTRGDAVLQDVRHAWRSSRRRSRSISASHGDRCRPSSSTRRFFRSRRSTAFSSRATSTCGWRAVFRCRSKARRAASAISFRFPAAA